MDPLQIVFTDNKCTNIRIDLTRDIPLTILGRYPSLSKKDRQLLLREIIYPEDFPPLADVFNEIVSGRQKNLNVHCRVRVGEDYHWMFLSCTQRRDTFTKTVHLTGTMMDVSEYLDSSQNDFVIEAVKERSDERLKVIASEDSSLSNILGLDYLCKIQGAFSMSEGIVSAMLRSDGSLICTADPSQKQFNPKKYKFAKSEQIRYNHRLLANWIITGNDESLLEKNQPLLQVLAQTVSQIANAILVLYNEMENSKKANQQLGNNIEQQILLNNIYTIILEQKDSEEALRNVIRLVGEYLKLDRIALFDYDGHDSASLSLEWAVHSENLRGTGKYYRDEFPELMGEVNYCDTYFSVPTFTELEKLGIKSFVVSQLTENGKFTGLILYETLYEKRIWSNADKKLLRTVSQIISTMLIRCNMEDALQDQNQQLKRLAFSDPVLDIGNRAKLEKELSGELEKDARGAAVAFKAVNMRAVNEAFGHAHSDGLLKKIAKYIEGIELKGKQVYRFNGDILLILLAGASPAQAKDFVEQLLSRFREPWQMNGEEHYLDMIAGISIYPDNGTTCEQIYRAATLSMYRAGEYLKNSYAFYACEFEQNIRQSFETEQRLRQSISDGMEGFSVEFQPIFSSVGDIVSMEAVVRWRDSVVGYIPPSRLIRLAERIGMDSIIDQWVIDKACGFCREIIDRTGNWDMQVNVNFTTHELYHTSVVDTVKKAMEKYGLSGSNIVIEVPERAQIMAYDQISPILGKLRQMDVCIAVDDFGKEFMSLSAIKNSYIGMIKMSAGLFIDDDFDRTALHNVIRLAHKKNILVCIKHIEQSYQLEALEEFQADLLQGGCISPTENEEKAKRLFAPRKTGKLQSMRT